MPKSTSTEAYKDMLATLRAARRAVGVTQVQLAKRLEKPQAWVSCVETGFRRIDIIEFYAIARALESDPQALFTEVLAKLPKRVKI